MGTLLQYTVSGDSLGPGPEPLHELRPMVGVMADERKAANLSGWPSLSLAFRPLHRAFGEIGVVMPLNRG